MTAPSRTVEPGTRQAPPAPFDVGRIRADFPLLSRSVHGNPLVYLDNAATSQKPLSVIDAVRAYYTRDNANVHRGVHYLAERATSVYEHARCTVKQLINARHEREIVFVRGTTEAINLVAHSYGRSRVGPGDNVVISTIEHHSNIVPWQLLCEATGAELRVIPMNEQGELRMDGYETLLGDRTKIVAVTHTSNALGTITPLQDIIRLAHERDVPVLEDGAQAVPHFRPDMQELDCDFYAFSGHKMFGPTGVGVLYGKEALLDAMPPYQGGGEMIASVSFENTTYAPLPAKFEAGTPNIAGVAGLNAAVEYLLSVGYDGIAEHEADLLAYGTARLSEIEGLRLIGTARHKATVFSFDVDVAHAHDVATVLDQEGIAVRAGHHCAQPVIEAFGVPATVRASLALYNTRDEIDLLVSGLHRVHELFS